MNGQTIAISLPSIIAGIVTILVTIINIVSAKKVKNEKHLQEVDDRLNAVESKLDNVLNENIKQNKLMLHLADTVTSLIEELKDKGKPNGRTTKAVDSLRENLTRGALRGCE